MAVERMTDTSWTQHKYHLWEEGGGRRERGLYTDVCEEAHTPHKNVQFERNQNCRKLKQAIIFYIRRTRWP